MCEILSSVEEAKWPETEFREINSATAKRKRADSGKFLLIFMQLLLLLASYKHIMTLKSACLLH